ncbi:unnamed protein product, partial [Polarella glacialis]
LEAFQLSGNAALGQSAARSKGTEAWGHAFSIAKAVLTGVQTHLPGVLESVKFREGADCAKQCESLPSRGKSVIASITVRFAYPEICGEFATRSRIGSSIRLAQEVCFALRQPSADLVKEPLVLEVSGLDFPCLEESILIRTRIEDLLGQDFNKKAAYAWWLTNRDSEYPLRKSKFRRVHASIFEGPIMARPPQWAAEK